MTITEEDEKKALQFLREINEIKSKGEAQWYKNRKTIYLKMNEEVFRAIYSSQKVFDYFSKLLDHNGYVISSTLIDLSERYPTLYSDILKNSVHNGLKLHLFHLGFHNGIEDINNLALSDEPELRYFAVSKCSHELLLKLKNDPTTKVRLEAYKRLGVYDYLDEMLEDKNKQVRLLAAQSAPMYYPKFKEMAEELSFEVFLEVAKKIDVKYIPYILGNRNLKTGKRASKYIKSILDKRLSLGNIEITTNIDAEENEDV